jgi:ubiquinone/menaquinone biosynthesis C-methylase UbiE
MVHKLQLGLDSAIGDYYDRAPEEDRLEHGPFVLEGARTRELIERFAPAPPATIVDVGGGAGAYAFWLADRGYMVHLVDATPRLIGEAQRRDATRAIRLASCGVGDARALPFEDGLADGVLLLGPLYHLIDSEARAAALHEALRILKIGGLVFAAAISRWASALDGLARDLFRDASFRAIVERDVREGQHRNPGQHPDYFTTAYFHRPEELREELLAAGFALDGIVGIEGPGWLMPDVTERMGDARRRSDLLSVARLLENEPSMLGVSAHLLAIGRKVASSHT